MKRKLTEKERAFLLELRELMAKYSVILSAEDERVCMDVSYSDNEDPVESIMLPERLTVFTDLEDFMEQDLLKEDSL